MRHASGKGLFEGRGNFAADPSNIIGGYNFQTIYKTFPDFPAVFKNPRSNVGLVGKRKQADDPVRPPERLSGSRGFDVSLQYYYNTSCDVVRLQ